MNTASKSGSPGSAKLCVFPGGRRGVGPVHLRRCLIRCNACGNTDFFVGRALVYPRIAVERMASYQYEVVEVSYQSTPNVDEVVECCAVCGSREVEVVPIRASADGLSPLSPTDKQEKGKPGFQLPDSDPPPF